MITKFNTLFSNLSKRNSRQESIRRSELADIHGWFSKKITLTDTGGLVQKCARLYPFIIIIYKITKTDE